MNKVPEMIFIIDTNMESLAVKEAIKLKIPIVAILDSNSDPRGINFPIPGNDDARRSIDLYCELLKNTILEAKKHIVKKQIDTNVEKTKIQSEKKEVKIQKINNPSKKKNSK